MVRGNVPGVQNQSDYLTAMKSLHGPLLDVHIGRFKDRRIRPCPRCGAQYLCGCGREYRSFEEKETDVELGAAMVADAALGIASTSLLISADTDMRPALQAVRRVAPEQRLYIGMPPGNTQPSQYLLSVGDVGHFFIRESMLRNAQLPAEVIESGTGRIVIRPEKWK